MATYNKFSSFVEALAEKVHNLSTDSIKVALTNTAPVASNTQLTDIIEISYTNCSSRSVTITSSSQSAGIYNLVGNDLTLTATGGSIATFRYIVLYNDSATNKQLICWYDYGSALTLNNGDSLTIDFSSTGILSIQ